MSTGKTKVDTIWLLLLLQSQVEQKILVNDFKEKNVQLSDHFNGNISIAGPQSSLIFYGAYNKTDTTTGALQFVDGMTLFYCSGLHGRQYPFEIVFSRLNFGAL